MTLAAEVATTDPAVTEAVKQLVDGRSASKAQKVLTVAIFAMSQRAADLARRDKLITELHAFFIQLTTAFNTLKGSKELHPVASALLDESARMAVRLTNPQYNGNAFWRAIILSLRAECLHLLGDEAAHAAALTADVALKMVEPTAAVAQRRAFIAELLGGGNPRLTRVAFLDKLHLSLPKE